MNKILNETENRTPTETEKRIDIMPTETEAQIPEAQYIKATDFTVETTTETFSEGNDNDEGKANLQECDIEATRINPATGALNSSTILSGETQPDTEPHDIKGIIKKGFDDAIDSIRSLQTNIQKAKSYLAETQDRKHLDVYMVFRDMVFFACQCVDNPDAVAEMYGDSWANVAPTRTTDTKAYRQAINWLDLKAGFIEEGMLCDSTKSMYANIALFLHPQITDGFITRENFIAKACKHHGGIDGYYDYVKKRNAKKKVKAGGKPKGMSSADADKKFSDDFNRLKDNQSAGNADSDERNLVSVVIDVSISKSFPSLQIIQKRFDVKNYPEVVAVRTIDDAILMLIEEGGESNA